MYKLSIVSLVLIENILDQPYKSGMSFVNTAGQSYTIPYHTMEVAVNQLTSNDTCSYYFLLTSWCGYDVRSKCLNSHYVQMAPHVCPGGSRT